VRRRLCLARLRLDRFDKALGVARRLTELGHYSPSAEAAAALKQEKGPASANDWGVEECSRC